MKMITYLAVVWYICFCSFFFCKTVTAYWVHEGKKSKNESNFKVLLVVQFTENTDGSKFNARSAMKHSTRISGFFEMEIEHFTLLIIYLFVVCMVFILTI